MLCKYYLQIGSSVVTVGDAGCHDVSSFVANSAQLEQSWERKDFGGVIRKYGSRIDFVDEAAELLLAEWHGSYVQSEASFSVHVADNNWRYSEVWQCPLDFSTLTYDGNKVTISCVDNSAAALIKANGATKSSFPVSSLKSSTPMLYDRIVDNNVAEYIMDGNTIEGEDLWQRVIVDEAVAIAWQPSLKVIDDSGTHDVSYLELDDQIGWFAPSHINSENGFLTVNHDCTLDYDFSDFRVRAIRVRNSESPVAQKMDFKIIEIDGQGVQNVKAFGTSIINPATKQWNCPLNGRLSLRAGTILTLVVSLRNSAGDDVYFTGGSEYWVSTNHGSLRWKSRAAAIDMDVIEPLTLLDKLLENVADGKMVLNGSIRSDIGGFTNERLAGLKILAVESVRGFSDAYIHTSFNQFAQMMESVFGYVYEIIEGDGTALVSFKHRSDMFGAGVAKTLVNVNGFGKSVDASMLYSEVKVGYDVQEYENGNTGNDEWNVENGYITGVAMKQGTLELKCPYRADCYGMEELVVKRSEEEKTEKDEGVFIVKCLPSAYNGHWVIDRSVTISGTYTDTVFNALLSPFLMVEANKGMIASFCEGLRLSTTSGNRNIMIDGVSVSKNFTFTAADRLFRCAKLKVQTDDQELPFDKSGKISFEWHGTTYQGYLRSVKLACQREEPVEYELIEC